MNHGTKRAALLSLGLLALVSAPRAARAQEDAIADADRLFDQGDYDKAADIYERVIEEHGDAAGCGVYGKRAAIYALQKKYREGLAFVDKSSTRCRASVEVREQHALLLWALGKRKEAVGIATEVVQQQPAAFSNQNLLGEYFSRTSPDKAITAYRAYLRHRPRELADTDARPRIMLAFSSLAVASREPKRRSDLLRDARTQLEYVNQRFSSDVEASFNAQNGLCAVYTAQSQWGRAVTICESASKIRGGRGTQASVWYNLSLAYLNSRRLDQARASALEFIDRGGEQSRGFELVGDSYFAQRRWADALRYYDMAEDQQEKAGGPPALAAKIGRAYRRLGRLDRAAERLETAWKANPTDPRIGIELGETQNALGKHEEALSVVRPLIDKEKSGAADPTLLLVAADAQLGLEKTDEARATYEQVLSRRTGDARARRGVIRTFNLEAATALEAGKSQEAYAVLRKALKYEPKSIQTNKNLAVLAIETNDCAAARSHLSALKDVRSQQVAYHRLAARAMRCEKNLGEAAKLYAAGAKIARTARNNLALAEIYTEWAPLTFSSDLDGSIAKLNQAVQFSFSVPEVSAAARRNRARALYLRGVRRLADSEPAGARADLEQATSDPKLLEADELESARLGLALARLEGGGTKSALDVLASLGARPLGLKGPYSALEVSFFVSYARYRSTEVKDVEAAARAFAAQSRSGTTAVKNLSRRLAGHAYLHLATLHRRAGNNGPAVAALDEAAPFLSGDERAHRVLRHNRVVMGTARGSEAKARAALSALKDEPVEALVNLGVAVDAAGDGKRAYDLWKQAKAKGYKSKVLDAWLEARQRVFGY